MSTVITKQPVCVAPLESALSSSRLEFYRLNPMDTPRVLVGRYRWNVALCGAIYPVFHYLEVIFRNRIHGALTSHFGTVAWYGGEPSWLHPREQAKVAEVVQNSQVCGTPLAPEQLIAELNFGFWTRLLSSDYAQTLWLDRTIIRAVFPFLSDPLRRRHVIDDHMSRIRRFRNRVFHHEPIWNSNNLLRQYAELRQTLGWFEPEASRLLTVPDAFEQIHGQGPEAFELKGA